MRNQKCIRKTISEDTGIKSFLDMIAPSVVKFNPDHFICGNTFRCVWALREYPTQTDEQALLRHLGEKDGITLRIYTRQLTPVEEDRIIQNATNKNRMGSSNTNDLRQTVTAESNLQDVASLIASMHRKWRARMVRSPVQKNTPSLFRFRCIRHMQISKQSWAGQSRRMIKATSTTSIP